LIRTTCHVAKIHPEIVETCGTTAQKILGKLEIGIEIFKLSFATAQFWCFPKLSEKKEKIRQIARRFTANFDRKNMSTLHTF
jgi:hypothetical protein